MISIDIERPGTYYSFTYTSAAGGFAPLPQSVALINVQAAAKVAAASINRVLSPEEADALFGVGSPLALDIRAAFRVGQIRGSLPRIYGVPIAEPSGGSDAATVTTIVITGTPTVAGVLVLRIAGRSIRVGVSPTSTANGIAASVKSAIDALAADLPVSGAVATNTVTCTARSKGVNGNEVRFEKPEVPAGLTVTITQTVPGVGASDPTAALDATLAQDFDAIALPNNTSVDVAMAADHLDEAWGAGTKRWRRIWFGENGSLGDAQTLAAINNYRISVGALRNARSLPSEIAAACATLEYSEGAPNFNFDGAELALYGGDAADAWTPGASGEVEALLDAGATPLQPSETRADRVIVEKLVTTQVKISNVPSFILRDVVVPKVGAFVARQIDAKYALQKPSTTDTIRDLVLDVDRQTEAAGYIRNVETLKPGVTAVLDGVVPGRANIKNPIEVVIPIHQAVFDIEVRV